MKKAKRVVWQGCFLSTWRRQREAGELEGLRPAKLAQAETVIVIQKKVASLLGIPLKSSDPEEND